MFLSRLRNKSQINLNKLSPVCILRSMLNAHLPITVCCSAVKVKVLKVIPRVSYYCSMGLGRTLRGKTTVLAWKSFENKAELSLAPDIYLSHRYRLRCSGLPDTASWAPFFCISTLDTQALNSAAHIEVCWDASVCGCVCVSVCVWVISDGAALPEAVLLCSVIELSFSIFFCFHHLPVVDICLKSAAVFPFLSPQYETHWGSSDILIKYT